MATRKKVETAAEPKPKAARRKRMPQIGDELVGLLDLQFKIAAFYKATPERMGRVRGHLLQAMRALSEDIALASMPAVEVETNTYNRPADGVANKPAFSKTYSSSVNGVEFTIGFYGDEPAAVYSNTTGEWSYDAAAAQEVLDLEAQQNSDDDDFEEPQLR